MVLAGLNNAATPAFASSPEKTASALRDLVFYKNKEGARVHVGILVAPGEIIDKPYTLGFLENDGVKRFGTPYYYTYRH